MNNALYVYVYDCSLLFALGRVRDLVGWKLFDFLDGTNLYLGFQFPLYLDNHLGLIILYFLLDLDLLDLLKCFLVLFHLYLLLV